LDTIDLVLLGIKTWNRDKHVRLTGKDIVNTLELARRLAARKIPIWVRFVLVPGLTDDPADIAHIANFAAKLGNVERVEVLPFHQLGRFKWQRLGLDYTLTDVASPSPELIESTCQIFRAEGLQAF
jgi:pyruvate formate lyase activating enzyme